MDSASGVKPMNNEFPRTSQLLKNKGLSDINSELCPFLNSVLVPLGMPKIDPADTLASVLDRVESFLRVHYLPVNYKGDL